MMRTGALVLAGLLLLGACTEAPRGTTTARAATTRSTLGASPHVTAPRELEVPLDMSWSGPVGRAHAAFGAGTHVFAWVEPAARTATVGARLRTRHIRASDGASIARAYSLGAASASHAA
ncbi:hypothetical protein L6R52_36750, partial [Myxococcota bacterium]|nr:hypothetical protein [Myxococcota bacterium]